MPPTKQSINQHNILHQHFPNDCCLCAKEKDISYLQDKITRRNKQIADLQYRNSRLKEAIREAARFISQEIADNPAEKTKRPEIFAMLDKALTNNPV